jgi:undecaprenyl-phosphate 4-deoxy-4-formamido-L-arabinose transferase
MQEPSFVSLVIPVFNEQASLDELIQRCMLICNKLNRKFEIILVDDGSADASAAKIETAAKEHSGKIIGVFLNRNYGQHSAILAGFEQSQGEVVITLDADLQNPPEEIPRLLEAIDQGADVVGTIRLNRKDTMFRRFVSSVINKGVQKATGVLMHDYGCMLRAYKRPIINAMLACNEHSTFIPVLANSFARNTKEIEVKHSGRSHGESKYNLGRLFKLMLDLLTSMTVFPLRLLSILGGIISILGIGFGFCLLIMRLIYGSAWAAEGIFTLFAILFVFIGAQFIGIGLLGEYLGRVYNDVRNRPSFFICKIVGKEKSREGKI